MIYNPYNDRVGSALPPRKARIEIIPLIDVIFFLLATFVLFTLSLEKILGIEIPLPLASKETEMMEQVVIQVSDGGVMHWNHELMPSAELAGRLAALQSGEKEPRVLIASDDRARYGELIHLLDTVRNAGIRHVSVETVGRALPR